MMIKGTSAVNISMRQLFLSSSCSNKSPAFANFILVGNRCDNVPVCSHLKPNSLTHYSFKRKRKIQYDRRWGVANSKYNHNGIKIFLTFIVNANMIPFCLILLINNNKNAHT